MNLRKFTFAFCLTLATGLIVACADNGDSLTKEERDYIRRKIMEEKYGKPTATATHTQTVSVSTTVTLTTTVNVAH
jgi:hypothetical protein